MCEGSKITIKACGYPGGFGKGVNGGKCMDVKDSGGEHGECTSATGGLYKSKCMILLPIPICFLCLILNIGFADAKMSGKLIMGSDGGGITSTVNRFFPGGNGGGTGILKIECNKLIFKGATSSHGGVLWLKCISFNCNGNYLKQCKIVNKGGKGDRMIIQKGKRMLKMGLLELMF